ncbi:unnamed protein product [Chrysoparadoxa australica]
MKKQKKMLKLKGMEEGWNVGLATRKSFSQSQGPVLSWPGQTRLVALDARERDRRACEDKHKAQARMRALHQAKVDKYNSKARAEAEALQAKTQKRHVQRLQGSLLEVVQFAARVHFLLRAAEAIEQEKQHKERIRKLVRAACQIQKQWRNYYLRAFMAKNHDRLLPVIMLSRRWLLRNRVKRKHKSHKVMLYLMREASMANKISNTMQRFRSTYLILHRTARHFLICRRLQVYVLLRLWVLDEPDIRNHILTEDRNKADTAMRSALLKLGEVGTEPQEAKWLTQIIRKLERKKREAFDNLQRGNKTCKTLKKTWAEHVARAGGEDWDSHEGAEESAEQVSCTDTSQANTHGDDTGSLSLGGSSNMGQLAGRGAAASVSSSPGGLAGKGWVKVLQDLCAEMPEGVVPMAMRITACEQFVREQRRFQRQQQEVPDKNVKRGISHTVEHIKTLLEGTLEDFDKAVAATASKRPRSTVMMYSGDRRCVIYLADLADLAALAPEGTLTLTLSCSPLTTVCSKPFQPYLNELASWQCASLPRFTLSSSMARTPRP